MATSTDFESHHSIRESLRLYYLVIDLIIRQHSATVGRFRMMPEVSYYKLPWDTSLL